MPRNWWLYIYIRVWRRYIIIRLVVQILSIGMKNVCYYIIHDVYKHCTSLNKNLRSALYSIYMYMYVCVCRVYMCTNICPEVAQVLHTHVYIYIILYSYSNRKRSLNIRYVLLYSYVYIYIPTCNNTNSSESPGDKRLNQTVYR